MRLNRSTKIAAVVAAISLAAAACTTSTEKTDSSPGGVEGATGKAVTKDETYKLGLALPLTGPAASYGEEYKIAVDLGIEDVNKKYAADGIKLEMVTADTQATAEGGVSAMNKLGAVEKAPAVLTAWSAVVAAGAPVAKDLGFAMFNAGAQAPDLIGVPNLVNVLPMNDAQLENFSKYLVEDKGYKKFAAIYVDNESGQGTLTAFKAAVEARGGKMVAEESIRQDATDATTQVAKVKDSGADFLYIQTLLVEGAATMKAVRKSGLDMPIGSYAGFGESRVIRDAGKQAENGLVYMSHIPEDIDAVKALLDRMQKVDPKRVLANQSYNSYFYGTAFIYAEAIKKLRAEGAPVTGDNILAVLSKDKDLTIPIIGKSDLTDKLTYHGPTLIQEITDYKEQPLEDKTLVAVRADGN